MASQIEAKVTFLIIFEARIEILFNIKVKFSFLLNAYVGLPQFCWLLNLE